MRAAIYLRISQDKTGEAAGVTRQQEDCAALADQLGWQVVEIYQDNDTSATSGKPRPAYRRMLLDIEGDRIDAIVTWHTDRLYRTMRDLEELVDMVEGHKLAIRTVRAGDIDLATPTGRMLARILGATAQHEVEQKADRWMRSIRQRREAGKFAAGGPRPFGYNRDGTLVPAEAEAIRRIAAQLLDGQMSIIGACRWLTAQGLLTTYGNPWQPSSLRRLLTAPRTAGLSKLRDPQTRQDVIIGDGQWEAILDKDTWEQLRAAIASNRGISPGGRRPNALLHGVAVCGYPECGRTLTKTVSSVPIYQCRTAARTNRHVTISAAALEEMVEAAAQAVLAGDRMRAAIVAKLVPGDRGMLQQEIADLDRELSEWRDQLGRTQRAATKTDIVMAMDRIRDQLDEKRAQLQPVDIDPVLITGGEWPEDVARRARLIRAAIGRVVVMPAKHRHTFDPSRVRIEPVAG
jgi:site-specific DNA recombinase